MSSYQHFAQYYDILTSDIPYRKRGEYFHAIINKHRNHSDKNTNILVDLACGTGSLSEVMATLSYDVIGIDSSMEMLSIAMNKRYESGHDIMYLCQDMRNIDLYGTMDICICALDSINHITDESDVQAIFDNVSLFLHPDGLFIFDVNTIYKHKNILADNIYIYDYDEVYCVWQNSLVGNNTVDITLDIFGKNKDNNYNRFTENFSERAYSHEEILRLIMKANLQLVDFYADDGFCKPNEVTQRICYVAKSMK